MDTILLEEMLVYFKCDILYIIVYYLLCNEIQGNTD